MQVTKTCIHSNFNLIPVLLCLTAMTSISESYTVIIGLNPALQKRFILAPATPSLISGNVHRASEIQQGVGGKGQDVFTSLSCLSGTTNSQAPAASTSTTYIQKGPIKLVQFLGSGAAGDLVSSLLSKLNPSTMDDLSFTIRTQAALRTCTTIVGTDVATELVEPSGMISTQEIRQLEEAVDCYFTSGDKESVGVGSVCIMGSMPPGCPPDLYATLYKKVARQQSDLICLVDSVVGLPFLLDAMSQHRAGDCDRAHELNGTGRRNNMLKINLTELRNLVDIYQDGDDTSINEISSVIRGLFETYPKARDALGYVAITNGKHPSYLVTVGGDGGVDNNQKTDVIYEIKIPAFVNEDNNMDKGEGAQALYPIGAGDTVAAGTLAAWQYLMQNQCSGVCDWLDDRVQRALLARTNDDFATVAFAFGLACGSASCLEQENSVFMINNALRLFDSMDMPQPHLMKAN